MTDVQNNAIMHCLLYILDRGVSIYLVGLVDCIGHNGARENHPDNIHNQVVIQAFLSEEVVVKK